MGAVAVPELRAHATPLPYLRFLLTGSQQTVLLAREGCCALRVPLPERFAIHKLIVSHLRGGRSAKGSNDVDRACAVAAVLADTHPGALAEAIAAILRSASKHFKAGLAAASARIGARAPRTLDELGA